MNCDEKGKPRLVKRNTLTGPSPSMVGLVDSGNGYKKENVFITGGSPFLLPEFIKKHLPGSGGNLTASQTCVNNKLTATPTG